MIVRGCIKAIRICFLYLILSTLMTFSVPRNNPEEDGFHSPTDKGGANIMNYLKDKLEHVLSAPRINLDEKPPQKLTDANEVDENNPDYDFRQYKYQATPHPSLQNDEFKYDYDDNADDNPENDDVGDVVVGSRNGGKPYDDINLNKERDKVTDDGKEDPVNDIYIPDCDIPPYPEMKKTQKKPFSQNDDDVNGNNVDKVENQGTGNTESTNEDDAPAYKQKMKDELLQELFDESSGDLKPEGIDKTEGNVDDSETVKVDDDFLKKLQELKKSLESTLTDKAPEGKSNLWNIMKEVTAVLEDRFGQVESMHNKMRVRDLTGRAKVKKIQEFYKKSTKDLPENSDDVLMEVKKARKRLKFITQYDDEDLLPDYMNVMQELISMLKKTKNVVRGSEDGFIQGEGRLGLDGSDPAATETISASGEGLVDENDEAYREKGPLGGKNMMESLAIEKEWKYQKQELGKREKKLKISKKDVGIESLDSDTFENIRDMKKNKKKKLEKHLREQIKSRKNKRVLEGDESSSSEGYESEMTVKDRKKKEKEKEKKEKRRIMKGLGRKHIEDL